MSPGMSENHPTPMHDIERLARRHGLRVYYVREFDQIAQLQRDSRLLFVADDLSPQEVADGYRDLLRCLLRPRPR